jgi:hypothetical protein
MALAYHHEFLSSTKSWIRSNIRPDGGHSIGSGNRFCIIAKFYIGIA